MNPDAAVRGHSCTLAQSGLLILLFSALSFSPLRVRSQTRLEGGSVFAEAVAIGTTAVVRIARLNRIIFPAT
jgi:hypothetical protein